MNREKFKLLFDQHFDTVRRFIYYKSGDSDLSTDIAQEAFMRVWEKGLQPDHGKELALLFRIASNLWISKIRKSKTEMNYANSISIQANEHGPDEEIVYQELKVRYDQALQLLTEGQREVFLMSRVDELSYKEMAETLEISVKAVEKRMSQALALLRKALLK